MTTMNEIFLSKVPSKLEAQRKREARVAAATEKVAMERAIARAAERNRIAAEMEAATKRLQIEHAYVARKRYLGPWASAVSSEVR